MTEGFFLGNNSVGTSLFEACSCVAVSKTILGSIYMRQDMNGSLRSHFSPLCFSWSQGLCSLRTVSFFPLPLCLFLYGLCKFLCFFLSSRFTPASFFTSTVLSFQPAWPFFLLARAKNTPRSFNQILVQCFKLLMPTLVEDQGQHGQLRSTAEFVKIQQLNSPLLLSILKDMLTSIYMCLIY